ncbi:MAG: sigma D regulator [Succinivibrio sp.]|nr:sigma D regulator [Succinivibrio sp.]
MTRKQPHQLHGFNTTLQEVDQNYTWINDMIKARQDLVLRYVKLLKLVPDFDQHNAKAESSLGEVVTFCEHMIDYVSHGHFDLYPKIIELIENASGRSLSIAQRAMPHIEKTTDVLMDFNDKYAEDLSLDKVSSLGDDLVTIGDALEHRFRYEDRLIIGLRLVHTIVETPH